MFAPMLLLLFSVRWVGIIDLPAKMLGRRYSIEDPGRPSYEICDVCSWKLRHLWYDLNA